MKSDLLRDPVHVNLKVRKLFREEIEEDICLEGSEFVGPTFLILRFFACKFV